jgi:hypothetical protein
MSGTTPQNYAIEPPKKKPDWVTPGLFGLIFVILFMIVLLIIAYLQVGSQCCCVPACYGQLSYNSTVGGF